MFKIQITDELEKIAQREQPQPVEVAKQLLAADVGQERKILEHLGMNHILKEANDIQKKNVEKNIHKEKFEQSIFAIDEIKELCLKYNLRFLPSRYYKGGIDRELPVKLRNFTEKHNINTEFSQDKFYILAPTESFNLSEYPIKEGKPKDPTIFYRTDDGYYTAVHHWGVDFTAGRRVMGMINYSWTTYMLFRMALVFAPLFALMAISGLPLGWSIVIGAAVSIVFALCYFMIYCTDSSNDIDWNRVAHLGLKNHWNSINKTI